MILVTFVAFTAQSGGACAAEEFLEKLEEMYRRGV
jgi:hypothetical protein